MCAENAEGKEQPQKHDKIYRVLFENKDEFIRRQKVSKNIPKIMKFLGTTSSTLTTLFLI
ncbi:MAG: hypothetical protein FWH05_06055 [Oscillospiraceae bacterium]|nr:hypothetical protein [Oscillospiraceae bacterium]